MLLFFRLQHKRRIWKLPCRTQDWWQKLLSVDTIEQGWCSNLIMSYPIFILLVDMIREEVAPDSRSFRSDTVTAEKKVAMTLYYLKDQGSFRQTGNTFGVSKATLSITLRVVVNAIINNLRKRYIVLPSTRSDLEKAAVNFEKKFGFPQVIGCVDGTHIPIIQPKANAHDYFCYKMKYSLNCHAVCDEKGQFIDVEVKWPRSANDARVSANSSINKKFSNKEFRSCYTLRSLIDGWCGIIAVVGKNIKN